MRPLFPLRPLPRRGDRKYSDVRVGSVIQIIKFFRKICWLAKAAFHPSSTMRASSDLESSTCCKSSPSSFVLPDLISHCPFPLVYHPDGDAIAQQSVDWLDGSCRELSPKQRRALHGLKAGELTAYCYNTTQTERLRVISDFMNYLFHLCVGFSSATTELFYVFSSQRQY